MYAATWIAVLFFLALGQYVWSSRNAAEPTIRGEINLSKKEQTIFSRKASFFLKKQYGPGNPGYEFRIITRSKLNSGEVVPFFLDPGDGKDATRYDLTVRAEFYDQDVEITYHPGPANPANLFAQKPGKFDVAAGGVHESLKPQDEETAIIDRTLPALSTLFAIPIVHAQADAEVETVLHDLDSPDPIIRGDARNALSGRKAAALPKIEELLASRNISYSSRLGSILALAGMEGVNLGSLSAEAYRGITDAANSADRNLMGSVTKLMERHPEVRSKIAPDPFVGVWQLNQKKSKLGTSLQNLTIENRRIVKAGDRFEITIRRVFEGGSKPQDTVYTFVCDGKTWKAAGQTITCIQRTPTVAEGEQSPPPRFYRRELNADGKTMTISVFEKTGRRQPISLEVFDRIEN